VDNPGYRNNYRLQPFTPFWKDQDELDYYVTASELLSFEAKQKGISVDRILPFGIPVDSKVYL
jgi:hypothetical protein